MSTPLISVTPPLPIDWKLVWRACLNLALLDFVGIVFLSFSCFGPSYCDSIDYRSKIRMSPTLLGGETIC